jgi:transcriptional regulator with XRE-family HTH domain
MRRWSIDELAAATKVGARTIGRIERGEVDKPTSIDALEAELATELAQLAASDTDSNEADTVAGALKNATYMQLLAELASRHAESTAEVGDLKRELHALRSGDTTDPSDVRIWRTADAPSSRRSNTKPAGGDTKRQKA